MDAGKFYGEDSGFCLMHNSLKQQCSEAIQKCQQLTYHYSLPNQRLKEIVDNTAIKAKGFDGIRQSASDYMIYINMVSASIASFENDYARLYQNAGDEDLIGSQLLADRKRLFNQLNEEKEIQQNLKARKTNTENAAVANGENTARITEEQIKTSNRIIDGYTQAIKQINEKIEKYYQIENNTRNYFKQGEEYSTKAQNILKGISKSFKGAEYHYDENADWRVDYQKCTDDMNVIFKDRAINYLKYRGVTENEFKQLAKYNFSSTEVYNYITLTNSKENEEFIMNIIHKKYDDSFRKDPNQLDAYAKTFMGKYALGVWGVMYEKGDKASKEDYEKFINAVLSDDKEIVMPASITGGKATVKNAKGLVNEDMIVTDHSMEYLKILSSTTLTLMKCNETIATNIYLQDKDTDDFKHYQREWNKCMSSYEVYQYLYNAQDKHSKDVYGKYPRITSISGIKLSGSKGRDVPTIEFDVSNENETKSEELNYAPSQSIKDKQIKEWKIVDECEEGPHETMDKLKDISQAMLVAGATEINPVLGLVVEVGCTALSEDGITNSYIEGKGKEVAKWANEKTNATGKIKEKANELYQSHVSPHMPTINSPYGTLVLNGMKKGISSAFSLDNAIGLVKAIDNDMHFDEKMSKEKRQYLEETETSYICCRNGCMTIDMQSLDLTTQIYNEELKNKTKKVYEKEIRNTVLDKIKGKKGEKYDLAKKLIEGDCSLANVDKDNSDLYFKTFAEVLDDGTSTSYSELFEAGVTSLRNEIVYEKEKD